MEVECERVIPAVPERTVRDLKHIQCDLCPDATGKPILNTLPGVDWSQGINRAYTGLNVSETEVRHKSGNQYGTDGGSGEELSFHICPQCFESKLVPWLKSQGAEPTVKEWDW